VWITLDKLKENDREVLVLKFFSGMTIDEISNTLQIGLSATKMRLYRAMSAFKEAYGTVELDNSMLMKRNMFSVRKMSKPLGSMQR